jgi:hypothetical protein
LTVSELGCVNHFRIKTADAAWRSFREKNIGAVKPRKAEMAPVSTLSGLADIVLAGSRGKIEVRMCNLDVVVASYNSQTKQLEVPHKFIVVPLLVSFCF